MAAYITFQPKDYYNTSLWTGNDTARDITSPDFATDMVWIKDRDKVDSGKIFNSVSGANKFLYTTANYVENTGVTNALTAFISTGFTLGTDSSNNGINESGDDIVSWNWKMGTTTGIDTTGTTITPSSYSFDQDRGQSIVIYAGNSTGGATLAHGLGAAPEMIIVKSLNTAQSWLVYHKGMDATAPEDYYMALNVASARAASTAGWNDTAPTSVNIVLGPDAAVNTSFNYIAYSFVGKSGYSKFGSFKGNANANGPFIHTGFRPAFILIKDTVAAQNWLLWDDKRLGYNPENNPLLPNQNSAEETNNEIDILSNGF